MVIPVRLPLGEVPPGDGAHRNVQISQRWSRATSGRGDEMIVGSVSTLWAQADGLDVAYDRVGDGPPLVLVHGAAGDAREWRPQITGLSDDFTVIAWDEPGAGRSSDLPASFGLAGYAAALAALLETLGAPAHVCGLSWGGTVALELYRRRPELVATLVLADTYAGWKGSLPGDEVRARVAGVKCMLSGPPGSFRSTLPGLFAGQPPVDVVALLDAVAAGVRPKSVQTALEAIAAADLRDVLPRIAVPTLLVWGELDARSPLSVAREFARLIPHAQLKSSPAPAT